MNRPGAAPQSIRNIPGNVFQNQQSSASRAGTLGSGRLQNGKIAGFGLGGAGTPGLPTPQSRNNTNLSSFAQTIGGAQSQAPLDLSEFPSLSGAPQTQQQNSSSQAIWGNPGLRTLQNPSGQRQPSINTQSTSSQTIQPPSQATQQQQRQTEPQNDSLASPFPQLGGGLDDFRFGQNGPSISSRTTGQQGSVDDFPPLGGLGGAELGPIRRTGSGQGAHTNGATNGNPFGQLPPMDRSGALGQIESQQDRAGQANDRIFSPADASSRATPMSRSSLEHIDQDGLQRMDTNNGGRPSQTSGQGGFPLGQTSQLPYRSSQIGDHQQQRFPQQPSLQTDSHQDKSETRPNDEIGLSQMGEADRWGLPGLMELLRGNVSADQAALALGMDLNTLGLDLHRPDNSPLHVDWAGPFADPAARPIIPEFTLPMAYTVTNVPPLQARIGSFSDDTLFMIFYQNPRDEAQELAAQELYKRDWRWHKKLQQWMMKAAELPEPQVAPSRAEERGWYYFWDANNWRRDRKEFILQYEHLHHPMSPQTAEEAFSPRS